MATASRKISAASARSHTRRHKQAKPFSLPSGMSWNLSRLVLTTAPRLRMSVPLSSSNVATTSYLRMWRQSNTSLFFCESRNTSSSIVQASHWSAPYIQLQPAGMLGKLLLVSSVGLIAWSYQAIQPPPPRICGSPNGPPVTSSRIKLKDGRHLSYLETGVSKEKSKYRIIYIHGFDSVKYDVLHLSPEVFNELGIYLLSFDRAGYGESDPNPYMSVKSNALDIEELADRLKLGSKFFVIGTSIGGAFSWGCLKYIPHRLAGVALLAPVSNYWWPGFPANLSKEAYDQQLVQDQWALRIAHYAPWLTYWWNTQNLFPASSVVASRPEIFSAQDKELLPKLSARHYKELTRQQGEFVSIHRDMNVIFGSWEFDPMDLENPFPNNEGSVHLWHGAEDLMVPVTLSRLISRKLPWIRYHELPNAGHLLQLMGGLCDAAVKELLLGDQ